MKLDRSLTGVALLLVAATVSLLSISGVSGSSAPAQLQIAHLGDAAPQRRAAKEIRRFVYELSGILLPVLDLRAAEDHGAVLTGVVVATANDVLVASAVTETAGGGQLDDGAVGAAQRLLLEAPNNHRGSGAHLLHVQRQSTTGNSSLILCLGVDDQSALYAAYTLLEHLGVRFRIDGDIVANRLKAQWQGRPREMFAAVADSGVLAGEVITPSFDTRGLLPFHDFVMGPDLWNEQEYKLTLEQMGKMKMNKLTIHTYAMGWTEPTAPGSTRVGPVCSDVGSPEPHLWLGLNGQFDSETGAVHDTAGGGAYPSAYASSLGWYGKEVSPGVWSGMGTPQGPGRPMNTSDYLCGVAPVFPADAYSSEVQMAVVGANAMGVPETPEQSAALLNRVADMLNSSFTFGRDHFGMKVAVGAEIPILGTNKNTSHTAQEYWEGTFKRVMASYPIDEFWFWMPETWQWSAVPLSSPTVQNAVQDLLHAAAAKNSTGAPFDLVTSGWTLGPLGDRGYLDTVLPEEFTSMGSIEEWDGWLGPDAAYWAGRGKAFQRDTFVIPWMEDDGELAMPQFWVNRAINHGFEAMAMGVSGLLGLTWRTREVSLQIAAIAKLPWAATPAGTGTLTAYDIYLDLATSDFGLERSDALELAALLNTHDSFNGPHQSPLTRNKKHQKREPGDGGCNGFSSLKINGSWPAIAGRFAYVDKIVAFRTKVQGAANLQRFDYWSALHQLQRVETKAYVLWADFEEAFAVANGTHATAADRAAVLAARTQLVNATAESARHLTDSISSLGSLGSMMGYQQRWWPYMITNYDRSLAKLLDLPHLPPAAMLPSTQLGTERVFAMSARSSVEASERYQITVVAMTKQAPAHCTTLVRPLNGTHEQTTTVPMKPLATGRHWYRVHLPPATAGDFEWQTTCMSSQSSATSWVVPHAGGWTTVIVV